MINEINAREWTVESLAHWIENQALGVDAMDLATRLVLAGWVFIDIPRPVVTYEVVHSATGRVVMSTTDDYFAEKELYHRNGGYGPGPFEIRSSDASVD